MIIVYHKNKLCVRVNYIEYITNALTYFLIYSLINPIDTLQKEYNN